MFNLLSQLLISVSVFAGEGSGHSHGSGGETERLWPVLGVFLVLVIAGIAFINPAESNLI